MNSENKIYYVIVYDDSTASWKTVNKHPLYYKEAKHLEERYENKEIVKTVTEQAVGYFIYE